MSRPPSSPSRIAPLVALAFLVLLAGCATMSVSSAVGADGTIETYQLQINTSTTVYGFLSEGVKEDGYDSLRESFLSEVDEERYESVDYDEEFDGDEVSITITFEGFEPGPDDPMNVTVTDDRIVYEDRVFVNQSANTSGEMNSAFTSGLTVHYYLEMPGEIVDSNANEVDGNTAEWHETGPDAFTHNRIYAESERPTSIPGVGQPGLGIGAALLALFVGLVVLGRQT